MNSNTFIMRSCAAATCALRQRPRLRCAMCNERRRRTRLPALLCYLLLPIVPPGSRAAVRGLSPQVRGGRCRSSAARAKCRWYNGFHGPTGCAVRKHDGDAFRRFVLTPDAPMVKGPHSYSPVPPDTPINARDTLKGDGHLSHGMCDVHPPEFIVCVFFVPAMYAPENLSVPHRDTECTMWGDEKTQDCRLRVGRSMGQEIAPWHTKSTGIPLAEPPVEGSNRGG